MYLNHSTPNNRPSRLAGGTLVAGTRAGPLALSHWPGEDHLDGRGRRCFKATVVLELLNFSRTPVKDPTPLDQLPNLMILRLLSSSEIALARPDSSRQSTDNCLLALVI